MSHTRKNKMQIASRKELDEFCLNIGFFLTRGGWSRYPLDGPRKDGHVLVLCATMTANGKAELGRGEDIVTCESPEEWKAFYDRAMPRTAGYPTVYLMDARLYEIATKEEKKDNA